MSAQILDFAKALKRREHDKAEDEKAGAWLQSRALEMLLHGVKPRGTIS